MAYTAVYGVGDMKEVVVDGIVITGITFIDFIELLLVIVILGMLIYQGKKLATVIKK